MLKKLRRKFILISMLSVFFVLAITISAINISNFAIVENNANISLNEVIDHGMNENGPGEKKSNQEIRHEDKLHEVHFFVCSFTSNGELKDSNSSHVFVLSDEECKELCKKVFNNEFKGRRYGSWRFKKALKNDSLTYVAFVDLKVELESAKSFLLLSSLISVGAYALLFVLILFASKIAFKPSEEAYKKQKKFITNASHELKTPLTIISADLDLIEMDNGKSEWSTSIRDQVSRLTTMTKQMVDLSRLDEEETNNYPFEDFSLNEVCGKAVKTFETSFKKENIKFAHNITGNLTMYGNKHLIDELIYIFLDNSLKYSGGENKSSYFVVSKNNKGNIEFRFSNTLDKNDETDVNQIMERFYRAPSNKKDGSGLGLSIAQDIVNLHNGKIKAEKTDHTISFLITF